MSAATWDGRERRLRRWCYWAWLLPVAGWTLSAVALQWLDLRSWVLALAPLPWWLLMAVHLAYLAAVAWRRAPGITVPVALLAAVAGAASGWWTGWAAALTSVLGLPLLACAGIALAPPAPALSRPWRIAVAWAEALRPPALLAMLLAGWVLFRTDGGDGLPPGHAAGWWAGGVLALVLVLLPSAAYHLAARRLRRLAAAG